MKIKKILFLSMFLMLTLLFIPNIVNAEINLDGGATIELENIKLGGKGQETTYAIGGEHFTTPLINITWFESSNGNDYTLMDKDSKFDYNIYYKAVLDTSYDELNSMMDEDWELGGISIHIIDETGTTVDSKSGFSGNSELEYVFEPFWKYKIYLDLENMDYVGPTEIVKGAEFIGQLIPKKNCRLPFDWEVTQGGYISIFIKGNKHNNYYNVENGFIEIDSGHIDGFVHIIARAVEKEKIEFKNNKYSYVKNNIKNSLEFTVPFQEDIDTIIIGEKVISDNDYFYDKTNNRLSIYDNFLDTLEVGTYVLRIENNNRYAETTFSVQELEVVDKITIDFREISNGDLLTEDQLSAFQFLGIDGRYLTLNVPLNAICDKNQKILFYIDEENNVTLAEDLSHNDNIIYTLSEEDLENYRTNYAYLKIPKTIEMIFAEDLIETYKVIFDANGGKFTDGDKFVVDDIINFDYANFDKPTREEYEFVGFFTQKTGGKSFEEIMNSEAGIESDMTFYAQWEENSSVSEGTPGIPEDEENNNNTGNTNQENTNRDNNNTGADNNAETGKNPQTSDNIMLYVLILSISTLGIIIITKIRKIR